MHRDINLLKDFLDTYSSVLDEIIASIKKAKKIVVIGHIEPDGDSVNSQLAILETFNKKGWEVDAINEGPFDKDLIKDHKNSFLKTSDDEYDLFIVVDTPDKSRLGKFEKKMDFNKTIVIDHHFTNKGFGKINWIDDNFISTSEMIFLLLYKMGIGIDDPVICQYILNGIMYDNGYFKHIRKSKPLSLLISYLLVNRGADPKVSYNLLFGGKNLASKKLLALALNRIESHKNGRILLSFITDKDKKFFRGSKEDSASLFNEMMSIKGVEVSILFKVYKNRVDISFRSGERVDVGTIAKFFGGGGHKVASGTSLKGRYDKIKDAVVKKTVEFLP